MSGPARRADRVFLVADIRGYTAYTARWGDVAALAAAVEPPDACAHGSVATRNHALPLGMGLAIGDAVPVGQGYRGRP